MCYTHLLITLNSNKVIGKKKYLWDCTLIVDVTVIINCSSSYYSYNKNDDIV